MNGGRGRVIGFLKGGMVALPPVRVEGAHVYLRPPAARDWRAWAALRDESRDFLKPWEPAWPADALGRDAYLRRLKRQVQEWRGDEGYAFLIFRRDDDALIGGIGFSNVRRGVSQTASLGSWIGATHRAGATMTDTRSHVTGFGFRQLGLHRSRPPACRRKRAEPSPAGGGSGFVARGLCPGVSEGSTTAGRHLLYAILTVRIRSMAGQPWTFGARNVEPRLLWSDHTIRCTVGRTSRSRRSMS